MKSYQKYLYVSLLLIQPYLMHGAEMKADSMAKIIGRVEVFNNLSGERTGLIRCTAQVFFLKDGIEDSLATTTNSKGVFYFRNIPAQRVGIRIQHLGMKTITDVYDLASGDNLIYFTMNEIQDTLSGAYIVAEIPLFKRIKDTTIVNTQAIKSSCDDNLRSLLSQIPGFVLKDNTITVDGRTVVRAYVNGTLVFGDRVISAFDALKADDVTQIRIYDELSPVDARRGNRYAPKQRVLDIITKEYILTMDVASAGLAVGADVSSQTRYAVAGGAAHHSEKLETHIKAFLNNISCSPPSYWSEADAGKYVQQTAKPLDSYKESAAIDISLSKHWKNRLYGNSINIKYNYDCSYSKDLAESYVEYFSSGSIPRQQIYDTLSTVVGKGLHTGRISLKLDDTPLKSFNVEVVGKLSNDNTTINRRYLTSIELEDDMRFDQQSKKSNRDFYSGVTVSWTNNDAVKYRPYIHLRGNVSNQTQGISRVDTLRDSFLPMNVSGNGAGSKAFAELSGGINKKILYPKGASMDLTIAFETNYDYSDSQLLSRNQFDPILCEYDFKNSFHHHRNQWNSSILVSAWYANKNMHSLFAGVSLKNSKIFNEEYIPVFFDKKRSFVTLVYEFVYNYSSILKVEAFSYAQLPAFAQISNRVSDSNPMVLTVGNPDLKQGYVTNFNVKYSPRTVHFKNGTSGSIIAALEGMCTINPIVSRIDYFDTLCILDKCDGYSVLPGTMLYTFDNSSSPALNISMLTKYSGLILNNRLNYYLSVGGRFLSEPLFTGDDITILSEGSISGIIGFSFKPTRRLSISGTMSYADVGFTSNENHFCRRSVTEASSNFRWYVAERLKLGANYYHSSVFYVSGTGTNHYLHTLNAGIEFVMLKDRRLIIGLWGYDVLNSRSLYKTDISAAMITQSWTPVYGRNIMISVSYKFNKQTTH